MKLYIAEKPSLGRAIADVLPKPHKKHDGYIEVANGDVVSGVLVIYWSKLSLKITMRALKSGNYKTFPSYPSNGSLTQRVKPKNSSTY